MMMIIRFELRFKERFFKIDFSRSLRQIRRAITIIPKHHHYYYTKEYQKQSINCCRLAKLLPQQKNIASFA